MIMRGSDYINVSLVPLFGVNQYDLGDVFLSPCRSETYSSDHSGICKDCTSCISDEYEQLQCMADQNRMCSNCTACNTHEHQICECNLRTQSCYLGNRVCSPLTPADINITFELTMGSSLSPTQLLFVENGLSTGFALYLSDYLPHDVNLIDFKGMTKIRGLLYSAMFIIHKVYEKDIINKAEIIDRNVVQQGLAYTFGMAFTGSGRRILAPSSPITNISAGEVTTSCVITSDCPEFFHLSNSSNSCDNLCLYDPCPVGFTGDFGSCVPCLNGTFKATVGNASCVTCPEGYTSYMGAGSIQQCSILIPRSTSIIESTSVIDSTSVVYPTSTLKYTKSSTTSILETIGVTTARTITRIVTIKPDTTPSIPIQHDTTYPNPVPTKPETTSSYGSNSNNPQSNNQLSNNQQSNTNSQLSNYLQGMFLPIRSSEPFIVLQDSGYGYLAIVAVVGIMMCGILSLAGIAARLYYATTRRGWFYIPINTEEEPRKIIPHTIIRISSSC